MAISITIQPTNPTVTVNTTQQFEAYDENGNKITSNIIWNVYKSSN